MFCSVCLDLSTDFFHIIMCCLAGVDSVGTISASLVTYSSIHALRPDLIINAGTAGGFKVYFLFPCSNFDDDSNTPAHCLSSSYFLSFRLFDEVKTIIFELENE